ncbi:MAG: terpene cyclase/mutase family protein, partial [Clostridiales bacterium]|nr:terpene cyclase/mutase family protein [Clostridiales bacterium]
MRKIINVITLFAFVLASALTALAVVKSNLDDAVNGAAAYMLGAVKNPQVDSVGGEWAVIGLARSGYQVPDGYYQTYYKTVEKYVSDRKGVLHDVKYTEYSRVILGLTAAGYDPRSVAGYDLTAPLEDFDKTIWQGVNGPVFALIALDSMNYPNSRRDDYIKEILSRQLDDGGWNLTGGTSADTKGQAGDPDITGMALQALAKYQDKTDVKAATDKALALLSEIQDSKAGYSSGFSGSVSAVESAVQVLVALCELGVPVDDSRFVKNGNTLVDNILTYKNSDGSFNHTHEDSGNSQMATEQALYALSAAKRIAEGKNSLYRMSDAKKREPGTPGIIGLPGKHDVVVKVPVTVPG